MVYLVDEGGKLVTDDTVYVEIGASGNPNACVLSMCSSNPGLSDIISAWGKTSAVFSSQEPGTTNYTITMDDEFVDIVEEEATPEIIGWTLPEGIYYRRANENYEVLVDQDGRALLDPQGKCVGYDTGRREVSIRSAIVVPSGWETVDSPRVDDGTTEYLGYTIVLTNGLGTITPSPASYE